MSTATNGAKSVDLLVIAVGINGYGSARDAAGRGLSVTLAEMGDLAQTTTSASTKLFHGGLRYLEFFKIRLVREALRKRGILLRAMRLENETSSSRLLSRAMLWAKGRRPAWLIRLGVFFYDHLGGRGLLRATATLVLTQSAAGKPLQDKVRLAYEYSDCWVPDARLVVLNAPDAQACGATILVRTKVVSAKRCGGLGIVVTQGLEGRGERPARALVNAGGPLCNDGASSAMAAMLNVFGGKITTYRRLAEGAMERLTPDFCGLKGAWTTGMHLPGGDFAPGGSARVLAALECDDPFLGQSWAKRRLRHCGREERAILGDAKSHEDLRRNFSMTLLAAEVDWLIEREGARASEDVLWRRTKLGLRLSQKQVVASQDYMRARLAAANEQARAAA